jgi:DnaK suppressor protein
LNKTLAKSAATPAKKVPAKVAPARPAVAPPPAKASLKPAPVAAVKPATRSSKARAIPEPAPAPITNRFTDRFAPARAPLRGHDEPLDVYKPLAKPDPKLANAWKTKAARDLTEAELLAMPDSEYMNEKQREFFRLRLQAQKDDLLSNAGETTEHLREDTSIVPDPADRATIEEEHALELRTRDRERKLLKKIGQSLARVESGDYGYCDETGEPIGLARLLARPTATLSLEAQQRREMKQKMFGD